MINSLENIRLAIELLEKTACEGSSQREDARLFVRAVAETRDASGVLAGAGLHPHAIAHLDRARWLAEMALASHFLRSRRAREALRELEQARRDSGPPRAGFAAVSRLARAASRPRAA